MSEQVLTLENEVENEFQLLEALAASPETTQADLAAQVGVAIGTVNWYLKRWSKKGYVKVSRIGRWQWSYLLTPEGIARKATLAAKYVEASLSLYRRTRSEAQRLLVEVKLAGYDVVVLTGDGEIAEICRLTCLELGVQRWESTDGRQNSQLPQLGVDGAKLALRWPPEN